MRISDWSSDVCSSDLGDAHQRAQARRPLTIRSARYDPAGPQARDRGQSRLVRTGLRRSQQCDPAGRRPAATARPADTCRNARPARSEEHTSELQSLMRISYAVFCLKKKKITQKHVTTDKSEQQEQK